MYDQPYQILSSDRANPLAVHWTYAEALESLYWYANDFYGKGESVTLEFVEVVQKPGPGGEQVYGLMQVRVLPS